MQLDIQLLHEKAVIPSYAHAADAGLDLRTVVDIKIAPGERVSIPTGLAFAIPDGYVGLVWDKSGISQKRGLKTMGGVIDAGYRGEVFVGLVNVGSEVQTCMIGDKIAQILIQKIEQPVVQVVTFLNETSRGTGAFGSTGK